MSAADGSREIACAGNWIVDHVYVASHWPANGDLARRALRHGRLPRSPERPPPPN